MGTSTIQVQARVGCTVPRLIRYCEVLLSGCRQPGILTSPPPVAAPWKLTQPALEGPHFRHPAAQCQVQVQHASLHLQPGSDRVTVSYQAGQTDKGFNMYCNFVVNMHALRTRPCESRNDQSPHCPIQWRLEACPGFLETMSTGLVAHHTVHLYWQTSANRRRLYAVGKVGGSSGAKDHVSHLPLFLLHAALLQSAGIDRL